MGLGLHHLPISPREDPESPADGASIVFCTLLFFITVAIKKILTKAKRRNTIRHLLLLVEPLVSLLPFGEPVKTFF